MSATPSPEPGAWRPPSPWLFLAVVPGMAWIVPIFARLPDRYPPLGSLLPTMGFVSLVLAGGAISVHRVVVGRWRREDRQAVLTYVAISIATAATWTGPLNALLDVRAPRVLEGRVEVIPNPGRRQPSRRIIIQDGKTELRASFNPHESFWSSENGRNGGPVRVEVGPGLIVPWIARIRDR